LIEPANSQISIARQCDLIGFNRASYYYRPSPVSDEDLLLMKVLDEQYTRTPFYGVLRMTAYLRRNGFVVSEKRVRRLLRLMGLESIYTKPRLSVAHEGNKIYPYLLGDIDITAGNQAWATDLTYIRLYKGFIYLVAIIDLFSRYVLAWEVSTALENSFCITALKNALKIGIPGIFNSDQGSQFTAKNFTEILLNHGIKISMDGKGRVFDNILAERLWRSVKYEEVYLNDYKEVVEAKGRLRNYLNFYNDERLHQSLNYRTPREVYFSSLV
jgi:putative transposase